MAGKFALRGSLDVWIALWKNYATLWIKPGARTRPGVPPSPLKYDLRLKSFILFRLDTKVPPDLGGYFARKCCNRLA